MTTRPRESSGHSNLWSFESSPMRKQTKPNQTNHACATCLARLVCFCTILLNPLQLVNQDDFQENQKAEALFRR
jgi:hypothetical protein